SMAARYMNRRRATIDDRSGAASALPSCHAKTTAAGVVGDGCAAPVAEVAWRARPMGRTAADRDTRRRRRPRVQGKANCPGIDRRDPAGSTRHDKRAVTVTRRHIVNVRITNHTEFPLTFQADWFHSGRLAGGQSWPTTILPGQSGG